MIAVGIKPRTSLEVVASERRGLGRTRGLAAAAAALLLLGLGCASSGERGGGALSVQLFPADFIGAALGLAGAEPPRRMPLAFVVSGGGFRTMTAGMAFARGLALALENVSADASEGAAAGSDGAAGAAGSEGAARSWDEVTHLGGNSGGQAVQ